MIEKISNPQRFYSRDIITTDYKEEPYENYYFMDCLFYCYVSIGFFYLLI